MFRKNTGDLGEKIALNYIKKKGYIVKALNYRCRFGEIDIIAKYKDYYVFIEVKTRKNISFGRPIEAINATKISRIIKTTEFYIKENYLYEYNFRVDAIEILIHNNNRYEINHIENICQ